MFIVFDLMLFTVKYDIIRRYFIWRIALIYYKFRCIFKDKLICFAIFLVLIFIPYILLSAISIFEKIDLLNLFVL